MRDIRVQDAEVLRKFNQMDEEEVDALLSFNLQTLNRKIVVMDDDPTGVQTVHGVSVYTDWKESSIRDGFDEPNSMFFILTNSRGFTVKETAAAHREMAQSILSVSQKTDKDFLLISRSDSTMRGHYPLETEILREEIESGSGKRFDGEVLFPFFKEGGRFTIDNVHYVREGSVLTPAGMTEFAKDKSFGYHSSHLGDWCEEKTQGRYKAENAVYISLESLRSLDIDGITRQLNDVQGFNKVIVNAVDYVDVKVFCIALIRSISKGKEFIFRSAAALTKVLGGIPDKSLLTKSELVRSDSTHGGIILVGSHVNKTTQQLEELKNCRFPIEFIEFDVNSALADNGLEKESARVQALVDEKIASGSTVAVFTSREKISLKTDDKDEILKVSVAISDAVTSIIGNLAVNPSFIVAKGGITSSDVGTKALKVKKALVMGQIKPGIPVWMTGDESKFPNMPYIIFPGNVGEIVTLREAVEVLMS